MSDDITIRRPATLDLSGWTALATGAGGSIGAAIEHVLTSHDANVAFPDVDVDVARAGAGDHPPNRACGVDGTGEDEVTRVVDAIDNKWQSVDNLVSYTGASTPHMVEQLSVADWRRVLEVNLTGPFVCSIAVLPRMIRQRSGKIVNIASVAAQRISYNGSAAYTHLTERFEADR